jgi:hypothetical protein
VQDDEIESGARRGTSKALGKEEAVVLGSGILGLVYLLEEPRRLTLEEIEARHPRVIPTRRDHPFIGFLVV